MDYRKRGRIYFHRILCPASLSIPSSSPDNIDSPHPRGIPLFDYAHAVQYDADSWLPVPWPSLALNLSNFVKINASPLFSSSFSFIAPFLYAMETIRVGSKNFLLAASHRP